MDKINVLIFPAGEINSIELHSALSTCVNIELYGASSLDRHGEYVFKNYISGLPLISDLDFLNKFNSLLEENRIDIVFPTHDSVALFLANNQDQLKAKLICADKTTTEICRDKKKTYEILKDCDFIPQVFDTVDELPVFIKPSEGQGSVGAKLINSITELPQDLSSYVICEYLPGEEYTVDCLTDKNRVLKIVSPRSRKRMMAGVCVSGKTEILTDEIYNIADQINQRLNFKGLWWFQIKRDKNNKWKLLEISTRCAGTMCLTRARGINLPLLSVYVFLGYDVEAEANPVSIVLDRTLISRYQIDYNYNSVYFDFDDTLVVNNKVHLPAIKFLYQCKNENKRLVLITKHSQDIYKTLESFAISPILFNEIIHIKPHEEKSEFITPSEAIFVDNAYQERKKIQKKHGIPTFDVDGLEVLINWRV
jgi:predicted ATP-grasp superfamily ATP-dependent carboligase